MESEQIYSYDKHIYSNNGYLLAMIYLPHYHVLIEISKYGIKQKAQNIENDLICAFFISYSSFRTMHVIRPTWVQIGRVHRSAENEIILPTQL